MSRPVSYPTLRRLAYFEAIAQAGSIRGAARRLGLSVPVLSSALSELEGELGVTLATRSTRHLELTSAGREIYGKASQMLAAAQDALAHSGINRQLSGTVGVTLPAELALHWLPRRVAQFRALYPAVTISVDANDRVVDLGGSAIDIAIRTTHRPTRPVDSQPTEAIFGWLDLVMVCREPPVIRPMADDLNLAIETTFLVGPGGHNWIAGYVPGSDSPVVLHPTGQITVANREVAIAFAREGLGCALVTEISVRDDLEAGRLVQVRSDMRFGGITLRTVMRDNLPSPEALAFQAVLSGSEGGDRGSSHGPNQNAV